MFFVTNRPVLFNTETGVVIKVFSGEVLICPAEIVIFRGSDSECEDFIYTLACWVGAVYPMAKAGGNG